MSGNNPDRWQTYCAHRPELAWRYLPIEVRGFLIRGSRKVANHYKRLIIGAENEDERQLYRDRIAREDRAIRTLTEL